MSWDKFSEFYQWEMSFLNPQQFEDEKFWYNIALEIGGPILEVAAGDGRITKHLVITDYPVTAFDLSVEMTKKLKRIKHQNLTVVNADMKNFSFNKKFKLIIAGYFAFQMLLTLEEQMQFLINAKKHLAKNGILALDIYPCVCEGYDSLNLRKIYEKRYKDKIIEMYSSYKIDRLNLIKYWTDFYKIKDINGNVLDEFYNKISLKECSPDYMNLLVSKANMKILKQYGSFDKKKITPDSQNIIYLIGKETSSE